MRFLTACDFVNNDVLAKFSSTNFFNTCLLESMDLCIVYIHKLKGSSFSLLEIVGLVKPRAAVSDNTG